MEIKYLYRYETDNSVENSLFGEIKTRQFEIIETTAKGFWMLLYGSNKPGMLKGNKKWVNNFSRNRFAYPTKDEALKNFIEKRTNEIRILHKRITVSNMYLKQALRIQNEIQ